MVFVLQMVAIFAIFWFLLIRPHRKEQQKHEEMIGSLKKGDEVVTNGGIIGKIIHADGDRLTIKTAEDTRLVVQRGRIAQRAGSEPEESS
ncbi:MAG: preprotein translocase subunit YajC [Gemmatimonadota bacterium]